MVFKNEAQLKSFLLAKCKNALMKSQEKVYQIIDKFVKEFYADYSPEMYERTYQLYHSLVKSDIVPTGNGFKAEVYFDLDSLYYITGNQPTGKEVMAAASQGLHGAMGDNLLYVYGNTDVGIWYDPLRKLNTEAINILKNMLIAEGVPIKK